MLRISLRHRHWRQNGRLCHRRLQLQSQLANTSSTPIAGPYLSGTAPAVVKDQVPKHGCQFGEKARLVGAKKAMR